MRADFVAKYKVDADTNKRAQVKLLEASEKVKKTMSANSIDIPLNLECFMDDKEYSCNIGTGEYSRKCSYIHLY